MLCGEVLVLLSGAGYRLSGDNVPLLKRSFEVSRASLIAESYCPLTS